FGEPWGTEVAIPAGFDYSLADGTRRSVAQWQALGLVPQPGMVLPTNFAAEGRLWLPAGGRGPAYLVFKNFDVFLTYNRSNSYALAVGLLANAIAGRPGPATSWPRDIAPLSVADVKRLQAGLNTLGFDAGSVDGIAGSGTRRALQQFQKARGFQADGFPTREMLAYVLDAAQLNVSSLAGPG
ncbi:MAG: peptidoglycan-binding protein, partial [Pseudomonadota bacterium]